MSTENTPDYLDLPDEDFARLNEPEIPADPPTTEEEVEEGIDQEQENETETEEETEEEEETSEDPEDTEEEEEEDSEEEEEEEEETPDPANEEEAEATSENTDKPDEEKGEKDTEKKAEPDEALYKALYNEILGSPIKANGKEIQLKSPEEAKKLIQMGANYTKKMQVLQPALRVVKMLENNDLLNEDKLSFLIDLDKGNPQAIQKLIADKKFDPVSVDEEQAESYRPTNHQVSDAEMRFNQVLDEVEMTETGRALITDIAKQWDVESKQAVYRDPSIIPVINEHKAAGIYDHITTEMDRQKALGNLNGIPFLQAYKAIGDMLADQGLLPGMEPKQPEVPKEPLARRTAKPKKLSNSDKARAAAAPKSRPSSKPTEVDYLDMPDDEFLKQMDGRL